MPSWPNAGVAARAGGEVHAARLCHYAGGSGSPCFFFHISFSAAAEVAFPACRTIGCQGSLSCSA